jgi:hypothetical protein
MLLVAGAVVFVCWLGLRDPLAALPHATEKPGRNRICSLTTT